MKLTTRQLRKIIIEELSYLMRENEDGEFEDRFAARKASEMIDDEMMAQFDQLESTGNYQDYMTAYNLATSLGSKEAMLEPMEFQVAEKNMIPKYIKGSIRGTSLMNPDRRIEYWQNQGVDLDQYVKNPAQKIDGWDPMHLTKQQFVDMEYKFLHDQLYSYNHKDFSSKEQFKNEMKQLESKFKLKIAKEIQKYIDSGDLKQIDGILYNPAPRR